MTTIQPERAVRGIHHITAISSDPRQTSDFYSTLLGLRLVKRTVNFDDPSTYHLYFGDRTGRPGTILTFFPFPLAGRGKPGPGQVTAIAFRVPRESLGFWAERLSQNGVAFEGPFERLGADVITFTDADGLPLELVANAAARSEWSTSDISATNAIVEFDGVTLSPRMRDATSDLLQNQLGMISVAQDGNRRRFLAGAGNGENGSTGQNIDILSVSDSTTAVPGAGTVHHIAWRCGEDEQLGWRTGLLQAGMKVTPIIDRNYFHSIYFREPGGVLFEIATDEPGFGVDEKIGELGSTLKLPDWLESRRDAIIRSLPPMKGTSQVSS